MKLQQKIISIGLSILILSMAAISVPTYWYLRSSLEEEINERMRNTLSAVRSGIDNTMIRLLSEEPDLQSVRQYFLSYLVRYNAIGLEGLILINQNKNIIVQTRNIPEEQLFSQILETLSIMSIQDSIVVSETYNVEGKGAIKVVVAPISGIDSELFILGWGDVALMPIMQHLTGSIFYIFLGALIISSAIIFLFSRSLVSPIKELAGYANDIRKDISTPAVRMERADEIGELQSALTQMHQEVFNNERANKQLLAGIAHEIKNPLGGMEIYTGLLRESINHDDEQTEYLNKINHSLNQLNQIVSAYLDFARPPKSELKEVKIHEIFRDISAILNPELQESSIRFEMRGEAVIQSDESKLRRVFLNLLQNSVQAVSEGSGIIQVNIESFDDSVSIEIIDNGKGIPRENIHEIFNPYYTTREKGHGLGLSISKNIIEELDGSIFVNSKVKEGTSFKIVLPKKR